MKADTVAHDLGSSQERVDLLNHDEDGEDSEDVAPLRDTVGFGKAMEVGDDTGGDEADDVADVGNDSQEGHEYANQQSVWELEDGQGDANENTVDKGDEHLPPEERDEIAVDFLKGFHDFIFKV